MKLLPAVFTLVLEPIDKELNFTSDKLIYRIVYTHSLSCNSVIIVHTIAYCSVYPYFGTNW